MSSIIKVDNIQDQDGNNIINENSNTITIGASGDTVTLASGASQTGFGRTGTVNWDTTVKTSGFTGVSGNGYFTNTTSSAFTITLPASPSAGDIIAVADYANTWDTNNLTLGRNGSNIEGDASDFICTEEGASITFVYVDGTKGWVTVNSGNSSQAFTESFMAATGGTVTTCGNCKIHTFTGPGTFTVTSASNVSSNNIVSYVVVAGGAAGGGGVGGGGGAGGYREVKNPITPYTASPLDGYSTPGNRVTVSAQAYPITVGGGGSAPGSSVTGPNGSNSVFSTITSAGGGGGSRTTPGGDGGSGGGGYIPSHPSYQKGSGNTPPVSPPQGNPGGEGNPGPGESGGGGGGAGAAGGDGDQDGNPNNGGPGGNGVTSNITGSPVTRAGGGGGSGFSGTGGAGGSGGGGDSGPGRSAGSGTAATGNSGGGGGAGNYAPSTPPAAIGGDGGSGIVIIRYKFQ